MDSVSSVWAYLVLLFIICALKWLLHYYCTANIYFEQRNVLRQNHIQQRNIFAAQLLQSNTSLFHEDRQGNIYTISDDNTLNTGPPRFADFFYLEPGSEEAARIRAQLEKDDKELPSYDEVMRMTSLPQSPTTGIGSMPDSVAIPLGVSTTSIATTATVATDISIPAPPYTEVDVNATLTAATAAATSTAIAGTPSTSRAAASMVVANAITTTTSTNA